PAGPVPGIPQLATVALSRRRRLVVPPSSAARRSLPDPTLWQGICGVLCSRKEIRLSSTGPPTNSLEPTWASHGERLRDTSLALARRLSSMPFGGIKLVASHSYVNATRLRCGPFSAAVLAALLASACGPAQAQRPLFAPAPDSPNAIAGAD